MHGAEHSDVLAPNWLSEQIFSVLDDYVARAVEKRRLVSICRLDAEHLDVEVIVPPRHLLDAVNDGSAVVISISEPNCVHRCPIHVAPGSVPV
jgi:hypothetical protein